MILAKMTFDSSRIDEMAALVPHERDRVAELRRAGELRALLLASDMSAAWLLFEATCVQQAKDLVATLPLARFAEIELTEVMEG